MHAGYTMNYSATFDIKLHIYIYIINNMLLQQNQYIRTANLAIDCTPCIALPLLDQQILNYYYKHVQTTV